MSSIAAGLASEGFHVIVYSIGNFTTLRCLEQIRNDICAHELPVTLVAIGAGFSYGNLGFSHHAVSDIASIASLPNMHVFSPADQAETEVCLLESLKLHKPCYLRLGKVNEPAIKPEIPLFINAPRLISKGDGRIVICATGSILIEAINAKHALEEVGINASVYSIPLLSPVDGSYFEEIYNHGIIVTIEEHVRHGGLGSIIREYAPIGVTVKSLCVDKNRVDYVGDQAYLRMLHDIDSNSIFMLIMKLV